MWKLTNNSAMPYGKYKGRQMQDVPADYLLWLYDNEKCSESVAQYIKENHLVIEHRRGMEANTRQEQAASRMPFGSYKGMEISEVPAEYLMAMYENGKCSKNVKAYIEKHIDALQQQAEKDRINRELLRSMYK